MKTMIKLTYTSSREGAPEIQRVFEVDGVGTRYRGGKLQSVILNTQAAVASYVDYMVEGEQARTGWMITAEWFSGQIGDRIPMQYGMRAWRVEA